MGRPAIEMIGKTFGEWKVLERAPAPEGTASPHQYWYKCQCTCGVERIINGSELRRGKTTSCGHARYLKHQIGDIIGDYSFDKKIEVGDRMYFEDMAIYSMVKNNTFNGIGLPDIVTMDKDLECKLVKRFGYEDFKVRLS